MPIRVGGTELDTIPILFDDVNALINVMNSLTDNYRLLVGAAEELTRTAGAAPIVVEQALDRVENTGILLDIIIFALALKLDFVVEVLNTTGLPINLVIAALLKFLENFNTAVDPDILPNRIVSRTAAKRIHCMTKWDKRKKIWEARKKKWETRKFFK